MPLKMTNRIQEIDYLKGVLIILMIIFHLVYIADTYPYLKKIVYTFHMPAFLVISGYLANINKNAKSFFRTMLWIFIPYAVMELGYVVMSSILPVREAVGQITPHLLLSKVFMHPLGPYWYLHTLVLCSSIYYIVFKALPLSVLARVIIMALTLYLMAEKLHLLAFSSAVYFMIGIVIHQSKQLFTSIFKPSAWAIIPLAILIFYPENLDRMSLGGMAIIYLSLSTLLFAYRYTPAKAKNVAFFLGRNTLSIFLFSPIFTILSKFLVPLFLFDKTGICFTLISVTFVIAGSLSIAWLIDKLNLARFCFGKPRVIA